MSTLTEKILAAAAFEYRKCPLGADVATQEHFDTLNSGGATEVARLLPLLTALADVAAAAEAVSADHAECEERAMNMRFRVVNLDRAKLIAQHDAIERLRKELGEK